MTWKTKNFQAGAQRSASLYADMIQRNDHLIDRYLPPLGGVSPLSLKSTTSGTLQAAVTALGTPATCERKISLLYKVVGGGAEGTIQVAVGASNYTQAGLTSTAAASTTFAIGAAAGAVDKLEISISAQSGEILLYGGLIIPNNNTTGIAASELPPHADGLAANCALSTDMVRRIRAFPVHLIKHRLPALAWFCGRERGTSTTTITPAGAIRLDQAFTKCYGEPKFKLSMLAPSSTAATLYGDANAEATITSSSATTIYTTAAVPASEALWIKFSGPVESYVVYEDVT